jgi:pantothenate kinase type III
MSALLTTAGRHSHCPVTDTVRDVLMAVSRAWTAHLLNRAIADVATMNRDYREVGLDRVEVLAALTHLREEIIVPDAPCAAQAFFSQRPSGDCCQ